MVESIDMSQPEQLESLEDNQKRLAEELRKRIDCHNQGHEFGQAFKVMFLSGPTDDETVKLKKPIVNDKKDKNGKRRRSPLDSLGTLPSSRWRRREGLVSWNSANTAPPCSPVMNACADSMA